MNGIVLSTYIPHIKVRNYLWIVENGELIKQSTPYTIQLIVSDDLFLSQQQVDELAEALNPFLLEVSAPPILAHAEQIANELLHKWHAIDSWDNAYASVQFNRSVSGLYDIRVVKSPHYNMY